MDFKNLCAEDLMQKEVRTVKETDAIDKAIRTMNGLGLSSLVVERKDENDAIGIITRKDILEALVIGIGSSGGAILVEEIMSKPTITVNPELSISQCYHMMRMMGVRRMPVVDNKKLVGILSSTDLFHYLTKDIR